MSKKALITGITGQDGSYLAEFLLKKGYEVHGIIRRSSTFTTKRINHIYHDAHTEGLPLFLHYGDLGDSSSLNRILEKVQPDEIYNLGAQSHVRVSFDIPEYTADIAGLGTLRILDAIRESGIKTKFYQASSSEMYGKVLEVPQNEDTPFYPRSPYAVGKVFGHWITVNYRESYDLFACSGILFNHESPRRGRTFVTRKIVEALVKIKHGLADDLYLGNLDAKRDWGFAGDYVEAMWLMLQHDTPDDYVIATGKTHSVREFLESTMTKLGMPFETNGKSGVDETYINTKTGKTIVAIDPKYFRPTEVDLLIGDPSKAKRVLGWEAKVNLDGLISLMIEHEEKELAPAISTPISQA
ncbi:MAG: GDPmannose 4,6-dehydratase [Candidatus Marinamargulisbacteria bacterium]|jgi:GDPmannose 4,6-dehydratase